MIAARRFGALSYQPTRVGTWAVAWSRLKPAVGRSPSESGVFLQQKFSEEEKRVATDGLSSSMSTASRCPGLMGLRMVGAAVGNPRPERRPGVGPLVAVLAYEPPPRESASERERGDLVYDWEFFEFGCKSQWSTRESNRCGCVWGRSILSCGRWRAGASSCVCH